MRGICHWVLSLSPTVDLIMHAADSQVATEKLPKNRKCRQEQQIVAKYTQRARTGEGVYACVKVYWKKVH